MSTLTLRNCDSDLDRLLKETSERRGISVNSLILDTLRLALMGDKKPRRYDDLDDLAGTWTLAEAESFDRATEAFNEIDPELWGRP